MSGIMQRMAGMSMRDRMREIQKIGSEAMDPARPMRREKQRSKRGPADKNSLRDKRKQERQRAKQARKKNKRRK
jgi:signal recognition particle subunit SRP54